MYQKLLVEKEASRVGCESPTALPIKGHNPIYGWYEMATNLLNQSPTPTNIDPETNNPEATSQNFKSSAMDDKVLFVWLQAPKPKCLIDAAGAMKPH